MSATIENVDLSEVYLVKASFFFTQSVKTEENECFKCKDRNINALKMEERKTRKHNATKKLSGFPVTDTRAIETYYLAINLK